MSIVMEITYNGAVNYVSHIDIDDQIHYYDSDILSCSSLALAYSDGGGYLKPRYGDIVLSPDFFTARPPESMPVKIFYMSPTFAKTLLYAGTLLLQTVEPAGVKYSLREKTFDVNLLNGGTDSDGSVCDKPIAMGFYATGDHIPFLPAQMTNSVPGYPTTGFYQPGQNRDNGLQAYILPSSSETTIAQVADPYGATHTTEFVNGRPIYIRAGIWQIYTLKHVIDYAIGRIPASPSEGAVGSVCPASYNDKIVVKYVQENINIIDFLDRACGFFGQIFYFDAAQNAFVFFERDVNDPSPITIGSYDFFSAPVEGKRLIRKMSTTAENGRRIEVVTLDPSVWKMQEHNWPVVKTYGHYGDDITVETFLDYGGRLPFVQANAAALNTLYTLWTRPWASVSLPIDGNIYKPGRDVVVVDPAYSYSMNTRFKIVNIEYDFDNETIQYSGPVSATS